MMQQFSCWILSPLNFCWPRYCIALRVEFFLGFGVDTHMGITIMIHAVIESR